MKLINLAGKVFGRLTVIQQLSSQRGHIRWLCQCLCGEILPVQGTNLKSGASQSCGCLKNEVTSKIKSKHGCSHKNITLTYVSWKAMRNRCLNPNNSSYKNYGGRGITITEAWSDFSNFLADMGERLSVSYTLDRIHNDGNYEKENCKWATRYEQCNNKRNNRKVEHDGQLYTMSRLATEIGIKYDKLKYQLNKLNI